MLRFWDRANAVTLGSLILAATGAIAAMRELPAFAMVALIGSGVCDLLDGWIARSIERSDEQRTFGKRLDSLVNACAFGLAPVVICHGLGLSSLLDAPLLALFLCGVVWRLAYFDTVGYEQQGSRRYYVGVPSTYVALVLPLVFLLGLWQASWMRLAARIALAGLAAGMVSTMRVAKPARRGYIVLFSLAIVVTATLLYFAERLNSL